VTEHVCRSNCIVPTAVLKAMKVAAGIFLPGECQIQLLEGTI
jgi:hypothetical protein